MEQILVERPAPQKLEMMGVDGWPIKTQAQGKHTQKHALAQECFLFDGELRLSLEGQEPLTLVAGDFFIVPANREVLWEVLAAIEYCYHDLKPIDIA